MEIELGINPWDYQGIIPPDDPDHWYYEEDKIKSSKKMRFVARRAKKIDH